MEENKKISLEVFRSLDPICVMKQAQINPSFKEEFLLRCADIENLESFSLTQKNRLNRLARKLSKPFCNEEFDWIVVDVLCAFLRNTVGLNKDKTKAIYDSFSRIPKSFGSHSKPIFLEKIRGRNKFRKNWGVRPILVDILEKEKINLDEYIKILEKCGSSKLE